MKIKWEKDQHRYRANLTGMTLLLLKSSRSHIIFIQFNFTNEIASQITSVIDTRSTKAAKLIVEEWLFNLYNNLKDLSQ